MHEFNQLELYNGDRTYSHGTTWFTLASLSLICM